MGAAPLRRLTVVGTLVADRMAEVIPAAVAATAAVEVVVDTLAAIANRNAA
jgi:hypothetical protein